MIAIPLTLTESVGCSTDSPASGARSKPMVAETSLGKSPSYAPSASVHRSKPSVYPKEIARGMVALMDSASTSPHGSIARTSSATLNMAAVSSVLARQSLDRGAPKNEQPTASNSTATNTGHRRNDICYLRLTQGSEANRP
ncbi:Uncharacterised protein [Mycobacteroides abscessus subsp. abscessus]|nr:Uncharacterised protein [Mycobacteroides abscessus subsp. abscessus]